MSDYVGFGIWALWAVFGFGVGRFTWRNKTVYEVIPSMVPPDGPTITHELPTTTSWAGSGPAPFRVVTLDGDVRYEGGDGATARRHVEALRAENIDWRAYRNGRVWDWGPRE